MLKKIKLLLLLLIFSFIIYSGCSETEIPLEPVKLSISSTTGWDSIIVIVPADSLPYQ